MLAEIHRLIDVAQDWLWTYVNIGLLVGCAIFFTFRMRGIQFRLFGDMVRQMFRSSSVSGESSDKKQISSFQAFIVALASRIGTGNLAGVATAISVGGPGAIFWMWLMALLGAATAFVESTLAQLYKRRAGAGYYGGPAYYIEAVCGGKRGLAIIFSIFLIANLVIFKKFLIIQVFL